VVLRRNYKESTFAYALCEKASGGAQRKDKEQYIARSNYSMNEFIHSNLAAGILIVLTTDLAKGVLPYDQLTAVALMPIIEHPVPNFLLME
jgi:hypothetical protein